MMPATIHAGTNLAGLGYVVCAGFVRLGDGGGARCGSRYAAGGHSISFRPPSSWVWAASGKELKATCFGIQRGWLLLAVDDTWRSTQRECGPTWQGLSCLGHGKPAGNAPNNGETKQTVLSLACFLSSHGVSGDVRPTSRQGIIHIESWATH